MTDDFVARLRIRWEAMGDMANHERAAAATEIESLRSGQREMMRTIATLRAERDEARQRVCSIAYPEQHIQELVKTINTLHAERDEARREACRLNAEIRMRDARADGMSSWFYSARQVAEERGWDCFKEGT